MFRESSVALTYSAPDQLNLLIDGVKTTFFSYPYPIITPLVKHRNIPMASISEIVAMKALAIGRRLAYKDYVDWYFMFKGNHISLKKIIALAKKKFGHDFNDRLFLGQLVSCSDIPFQKIDFLEHEVKRSVIENYLADIVKNFQHASC